MAYKLFYNCSKLSPVGHNYGDADTAHEPSVALEIATRLLQLSVDIQQQP